MNEQTKQELLARVTTNGKKAAIAAHNKDIATMKWFSDDTLRICRTYPEFYQEFDKAHRDAYKAESSQYQPLGGSYYR